MDSVRAQSEDLTSKKLEERDNSNTQASAQWIERLTPLEDRLSKLLAAIPPEVKDQGLSLSVLRGMLAGKWRGNCHPGELGVALRKLGYARRRNWSESQGGFKSTWYHQV